MLCPEPSGVVIVSLAIDRKGRLADGIDVRSIGLPGESVADLEEALDDLAECAERAVTGLDKALRQADDEVETAVNRAVKKACQRIWQRRPVVETIVVRV